MQGFARDPLCCAGREELAFFPGHCEFYCSALQGIANSCCRVWSLLTVEDTYSQLSKLHLYQLWGAFAAFLKPCFNLRFR